MDDVKPTTCSYSLMVIILNRGMGDKVLQFAKSRGAREAMSYYGEGTDKRQLLKILGLDEIEREVITLLVPVEQGDAELDEIEEVFALKRPGTGVAFTIPLAATFNLKKDGHLQWPDDSEPAPRPEPATHVLGVAVMNKGKAAYLFEIFAHTSWFGGTVIKAAGQASHLSMVLNMQVEQAKEVMLMIVPKEKEDKLIEVLTDELELTQPNTGILVTTDINKVVGLFDASERSAA